MVRGLGSRWAARACRCCRYDHLMISGGIRWLWILAGRARPVARRVGAVGGRGVCRPGGVRGVCRVGLRWSYRRARTVRFGRSPKAYFTSRGACMGRVSGEVVAAAFGCFNPKVVVPAVEAGWRHDPDAVLQARERAATEMLQRVLGEQPEGIEGVTQGFAWRLACPDRPPDLWGSAVAGLPRSPAG